MIKDRRWIILGSLTLCILGRPDVISGEEDDTIVSMKPGQSEAYLSEQWQKLPQELRSKIDAEIMRGDQLGVSSTGGVHLIGVYHQRLPEDRGGESKRLYHFQHADLFGSRLFWSMLVDPQDETFRILFHIHPDKEQDWTKLGQGRRHNSPRPTKEDSEVSSGPADRQ